jgi:hypothetical protein
MGFIFGAKTTENFDLSLEYYFEPAGALSVC